MSDIFSVSSNAVNAYQRALGTVSNNIANVGTEGYVRQETNLVENPSRQVGNVYLGTGVRFAGIHRAYDQFLETNLRNSSSDLATQEPMVTYANRIVDIMGSDTVGLPPAMDKFFASARALSTDPASSILRGQFLRDADGLAARFRELSTQMDVVDTETRSTINEKISSINTLSGQLATINKQLARETRVDAQPAELMDQRDRLLTALSKLVKINVTTALNGSVNISIGNTASAGVILNGQTSVQLGAKFDETDLSKVTISADPYGKTPETIAGVSNGELGGLMTFREQVLQPTVSQLDFLAQTVVDEINAVHRNGIDANGDMGKNLFAIAPTTRIDAVSGQTITIQRAAAGIKIAFNDATKVAAGSLFRVIENANNISGVDASLSYSASYADPTRVKSLSQVISNNPSPSAGINAPANQLLGQIPQGSSNWSLYLDGATGNQQMQVFTRDGRQILGATLTDDAERRALMTTANGFVAGSTYSDQYLNQSGVNGYKQISVFYGAKAEPGAHFAQDARFTNEHDVLPSIRLHDVATGAHIPSTLTSIPANTLSINGKVLPSLLPQAPSKTIQASDIARWMNRAADGMVPTVAINSSTTATVAAIDPTKGMYVNGIAVPADGTRNLAGLVSFINDQIGNQSNVLASANGSELVLTNAIGYDGNDIRVGEMDANGDLVGETVTKGILDFSQSGDITIGYGPDGQLGDFEMLGTPAGKYSTALLATETTPAVISGSRIASGLTSIDAGAITLNGQALPALAVTFPATSLKASDLVTWMNSVGSALDPQVTASGSNEIRTSASMINLTGSLKINGATITPPAGSTSFADATVLVTQINNTDTSGGNPAARVSATLIADGSIVLSNTTGENITLGSTGSSNALGVGNGIYQGNIALSSQGEIKLGFGTTGKPVDLARLGIRTGAYIDGATSEDLLVFVTGEGSATVSGSYDASMADPTSLDTQRITSLREQKFDITFTSATHYQITWTNPANGLSTVLAERNYDEKAGITYQGLKLTLSNAPSKGDKFIIDGNQDGIGNNQNMLDLAAIEEKSVIGGANGSTLSEAYEQQVGNVGNLAGQATIAQQALEVVNNQAIESRDAVSGVSLDSEAADLIRFQQAYQACAKAMQVASTIFDAILAVR